MKTSKLKNLSDIITGYTFRESIKDDQNGTVRVIQGKNLNSTQIMDTKDLIKIDKLKNSTNSFTQFNDIVLNIKGNIQSSIIKYQEPSLASSSVIIIRVKSVEILPDYLNLYLNSSVAQRQISRLSTGGVMKTIQKAHLQELEIYIPNLKEQEHIVNIANNIEMQKQLLNRKLKINENIYSTALNKILNNY
jgi:restriction endonuclease S subunit